MRAAQRLETGDPSDVAARAVEIATTNMAEAARVVSVARGVDPAGVSLLAFGGAGALHACTVGDMLGCSSVLVPLVAGTLSAAGLAVAGERAEATRSILVFHDAAGRADIDAQLQEWIRLHALGLREQVAGGAAATTSLALQLRFRGQAHPIEVEVALADTADRDIEDAFADAALHFRVQHLSQYGHVLEQDAIETVAVRVMASTGGVAHDLRAPLGTPEDIADVQRALPGDRGLVLDLAHGACLVPSGWSVAGQAAGCLQLLRSGAGA
jgi:N-methylhydantoinase A